MRRAVPGRLARAFAQWPPGADRTRIEALSAVGRRASGRRTPRTVDAAMHILGINAAFHDSSAGLVRDGVVVAAAEEERFSRIKHAKRATPYQAHALPFHDIDYCLAEGGITLADVDHVAYSLDPFL